MKFIATVLCLAFVTSFVDARYSSEEGWDDDYQWDPTTIEELQGEDRFLGSLFGMAKGVVSTVADTATGVFNAKANIGKTAINLVKGTTFKAADFAKDVTVKSASLAKDATVGAARMAKDVSVTAAKAGIDLVQYISESSTTASIDVLLYNMKLLLKMTGKETIVLPEMDKKFSGVSFKTSEGYFRTLRNLTRSGKAKLSMDGLSLVITFPLTITGLEVGYPEYTAKFLFITSKGAFDVHIQKNTVEISMSLTPGLTCQMNVNKVEVTELEGITIKFKGICNGCDTVVETIATALANHLKETIKAKVQSTINDAVQDTLKNNPLLCANFTNKDEEEADNS